MAGLFEIGYATTGTTDAFAETTGVGRGHFFVMGVGAIAYEMAVVTVDFGVGGHRDSERFSQNTTSVSGTGDATESKSSLTSSYVSTTIGLRTPRLFLWRQLCVTALGALGTSKHWMKRQIDDCVDCREDKIDVQSGPFWQAGFALGAGERGAQASRNGLRLGGIGASLRRPFDTRDLGTTVFITIGLY